MIEAEATSLASRSEGTVSARWVLGIWSVPIVLGAFASYANARELGQPVSAARALWLGLGTWLIWAPLTPIIVRLGQHWPLDRRKHWRIVPAHLAAAALIGLTAAALTALAVYDRAGGQTLAQQVGSRVLLRAPMGSTLYFIILGISYLTIKTRRLRERELLAERLSRELTEAQLGALRMQLQPHFLFNSLNAVMALVRDQDTERADRALILLSDVLRTTVRDGVRQHIQLEQEVSFIRNYLEIESLRFGDRLTVVCAIPDELGSALVPTFILQPLVENALQHGLLGLRQGGTLQLAAERRAQTLVLTVLDDGAGLAPDWEKRGRHAVGISNVRARLAHLYGSVARVTITARTDRSGTRATIELPCHEARA
ncbi:MAG: sensor histidine kinase [Longimicrobiales bacterium]